MKQSLAQQIFMTFSLSRYSKSGSSYESCTQQQVNNFATSTGSSWSKQEQYTEFFKDVMPAINRFNINDISRQQLLHNKIKVLDSNDPYFGAMINDGAIYVEPSKIKFNGLQTVFDVLIGRFYLVVHVLNLFRNSTEKKINEKKDQKYVGSGTFGTVKLANVEGKQIAIKRLNFPEGRIKPIFIPYLLDPADLCNPDEIRKAIKEYCIYKICSLLKIGPQVIFTDVYDLVCYNDGIEFQMQLCKVVEFNIRRSYATDLKQCVAKLHALKLVHNDIKPQNTLLSPSLDKYVLSDFGLSQSIKERVGQKTETYFKGTMKYASNQMKALHPNKLGSVDLFYHDMHSLKVCIQQVDQYISSESESESSGQEPSSRCRNQFSMIQREESEVPGQSVSSSSSGYQEQYREATTQSSSSYESSILSEQFLMNSVEINYYIMKTLYCLFQGDTTNEVYNQVTNNQQKMRVLVGQAVGKVCGMGNYPMLDIVLRMVNGMLLSPDQKINDIITSTRSTLRIYGFYSDQFTDKLAEIEKSRPLPFLNSGQLHGRIRYLQKFMSNYASKKFERVCSNLEKNRKLRNEKTYLDSIRFILKRNQATADLSSHIKKIIMKGCLQYITEIQASEIPLIYTIFKPFLDPTIAANQATYQLKLTSNQKFRLVEYLYKVAKAASFYNCVMGRFFFQAYSTLGAKQIAQTRILSQMFEEYQSVRSEHMQINSLTLQNRPALYLPSVLSLIVCLSTIEIKQTCVVIFQNLEEAKNAPLSYQKIAMLSFSAKVLLKQPEYLAIAEELNQVSYELTKQYFFPVVDSMNTADYFFAKGVIAWKRQQATQALEYFQSATVALSDQLCIAHQFEQIEKIYTGLYLAYEDLGNYQSALKCFQHMTYLNFENERCSIDKKLVYLGNFIKYKIKLNNTEDLYQLFDLFFKWKMSLAKDTDTSEFSHPSFRRVPAFIWQSEQTSPFTTMQTLVAAKKALVQVLSKYLPVFLAQYRNQCEWIARYNIDKLHMKSKALPYLWNYFRKFPYYQISEDDCFFEKLHIFASMLIESNSNRIAFKFLENYAYKIPNENFKLKQLIFKKLYILSRDLGNKKFKLYNLIYKHRPFQSKLNYQFCLSQINDINEYEMKLPLKKALLKKILPLQPECNRQCQQNTVFEPQVEEGNLTIKQLRILFKQKKGVK